MLYKDYVERKVSNAIRIKSAEGYPCVFDNSKGRPLKDYKIYGNSIQDGTPTPDNPIEIQSVGDLVTDAASEYYGKYAVPVKVCGKNLFDKNSVELTNGKHLDITTGKPGAFKGKRCATIKPIDVSNYKEITVSYSNVSVHFMYSLFDNENNLLIRKAEKSSGDSIDVSNASYIYISFYDVTAEMMENIQIEEGTGSTDYEPYYEPITTHIYLNEPLRKVGDYADYIDFKKGKVVRNVVELNLLSEHVADLYTYNGMVGIRTNPILRESMRRESGKCNRVESSNIGYYFQNNAIWLGVGTFFIYWIGILDILGLSTINEFKEWIDNNPTHIYYGVKSSAEEDIELPKILTQKGSNIITAATAIEPSYIEVKYIAK